MKFRATKGGFALKADKPGDGKALLGPIEGMAGRSRTRVVNLRHKGVAELPGLVRVDRSSEWGNPSTVREHGPRAMLLFLLYLREHRPDLVERAPRELRGKPLGCHCVRKDGSKPCHAKVWAALADGDGLPLAGRKALAEVDAVHGTTLRAEWVRISAGLDVPRG